MNQITVYTTNTCPYCKMVKNFLNQEGLPFKEVNVQMDQQAARQLVAATGQMGVPQTKVNGHWVLGFDPNSIKSYLQ